MTRHEGMLERMDSLLELQDGWDGPGSYAISYQAFSIAANHVGTAIENAFGSEHRFMVAPMQSGGYLFEYQTERDEWILIEVCPAGVISYSYGWCEEPVADDQVCTLQDLIELLAELALAWEAN